jgi:hypothetical protein
VEVPVVALEHLVVLVAQTVPEVEEALGVELAVLRPVGQEDRVVWLVVPAVQEHPVVLVAPEVEEMLRVALESLRPVELAEKVAVAPGGEDRPPRATS